MSSEAPYTNHTSNVLPPSSSPPRFSIVTLVVIYRRRRPLRGPLYDGSTIPEACTEQDIRVRDQALFEQNNGESGAIEARKEELADVLHAREVEGGVNFVEDIHRGRFELKDMMSESAISDLHG